MDFMANCMVDTTLILIEDVYDFVWRQNYKNKLCLGNKIL